VRRKLEALRERGWIEQDSPSGWRLSVKDGATVAAVALADLDSRGIARGARLAAAFARRL
jgi:DNA-binding IclR family transcriptional regulator